MDESNEPRTTAEGSDGQTPEDHVGEPLDDLSSEHPADGQHKSEPEAGGADGAHPEAEPDSEAEPDPEAEPDSPHAGDAPAEPVPNREGAPKATDRPRRSRRATRPASPPAPGSAIDGESDADGPSTPPAPALDVLAELHGVREPGHPAPAAQASSAAADLGRIVFAEPRPTSEVATAPGSVTDDVAPAEIPTEGVPTEGGGPRLPVTTLLFQAPDVGAGRSRGRRAQAPAGPPAPAESDDAATPDASGRAGGEASDAASGGSSSTRSSGRSRGQGTSGAKDKPGATGATGPGGDPAATEVAVTEGSTGPNGSDAPDGSDAERGSIDADAGDGGSAPASDGHGTTPSGGDGAAGAEESGSEDPNDEDRQTGQPRRRRRRGGRGRRSRGGSGGSDAGEARTEASIETTSAGTETTEGDGADSGDETPDGSEGATTAESGAAVRPAAGGEQGGEPDGEDQEPGESGDGSEGSSRRRRRRRRGAGRTGEGEAEGGSGGMKRNGRDERGDEVTAFKGSTRLEAKRQRRRDGRDAGRRRTIVTEAEFLARRESVDRAMVVREAGGRTQIAVLEDGVLVEHFVARRTQTSSVGNVYLGRVQNVLPSMEAAFVDLGKGRNAVLYAGELNWDAAGMEGQPRRIEQALSSGDSVLVQVTKDPIGHKGARLTSQITLAGRYLVLVPSGGMTGISRKLPDTERARLKRLLKEIVPDGAGVIVRTAAEGASEDELRRDVARLQAQWAEIQRKATTASAPAVLSSEPDLAIRVVRDVFNEDFGSVTVSGDEAWDTISTYIGSVASDLSPRLHRWTSDEDVFAANRVDEQLSKALDRKVWLPSGGSLVIDRTEAMIVIDVNTGKFTGTGGTLEETVTRNNLEAAEEIVRQLRLRDIGGIIVIDFIDMVLESNRDLVLRRLVECLGRDRTRHQVAEVTSLGLVQMTRKRVGQGLLEAFSETCECCSGRGYLVHAEPVEKEGPGSAERSADEGGRSGSGGRRRARRGGESSGSSRQAASGQRGAEPDPESVAAREAVKATLATIAAAAAHAHGDADADAEAASGGAAADGGLPSQAVPVDDGPVLAVADGSGRVAGEADDEEALVDAVPDFDVVRGDRPTPPPTDPSV